MASKYFCTSAKPFSPFLLGCIPQSLVERFSSYECDELVGTGEPLYDRCLTLQIQWDHGWMEWGQINAPSQVSGGNGDKDMRSAVRGSPWCDWSSWSVCACMGQSTAEWPRQSSGALGTEPGETEEPHLTTVAVMNGLADELSAQRPASDWTAGRTPSVFNYSSFIFISCCAFFYKMSLLVYVFPHPPPHIISPQLILHCFLLPAQYQISVFSHSALQRQIKHSFSFIAPVQHLSESLKYIDLRCCMFYNSAVHLDPCHAFRFICWIK